MIHPISLVDPRAVVGDGVSIGPFCVIGPNVEILAGTIIQERCSLGLQSESSANLTERTVIGSNSLIRSGSVIYSGVWAGSGLQTGHNVIIRENTLLGDHCSIGSGTQLQGGSKLGDRVRLHSNVHIGSGVVIEDDVWLYSNVLFTTDPNPPSKIVLNVSIGKESVILAGSLLMPGVSLASRSVVLPQSKVTRSFDEEDQLIGGSPARSMGKNSILRMSDNRSIPAYPWKHRYLR